MAAQDAPGNVGEYTTDGDSLVESSSSGPSLEVDSDDRDSAFGDTQSTLTMSATSSVFNFRYENGRRYHAYAEGKYPVPNDETEADRLDLQHHAFRLTLDGKLYRAPIPDNVQHVLDVGCGTGIWSIEYADEHPSARVIGTDLSPIQPTAVPPNCEFLIDDCEQDWIFRNLFDFVHTRAMVAAIKDWPRFFQQAYTNLRPGGYLECQEITFPIGCMNPEVNAENSPLMRWSALFIEAAGKIGIDGTGPRHFAPKLRDAGFEGIHVKTYKWPLGKWAKGPKNKLLGRFVYADLMDWLPSSALGLFTRILKWSREEVELFLHECRQEMKRKDRHYYAEVLFWYAHKPEDASMSGYANEPVHDEEILEYDSDERAAQESAAADNQSTRATAQASDSLPVESDTKNISETTSTVPTESTTKEGPEQQDKPAESGKATEPSV